ncbi:MAG: hypothetical protein AAF570_07765 [Bacteroidota bacterium]
MSASVPLFELIRSLSRDEVNNFLRYARMKGDVRKKKYLQLFEAIREQDRYDEAALRERFKGQKMLNQLSAAKNYLIKLILKSLVYNSRTPANEVELLIMENEALIQKGQWKLAERYVKKALKKAMKEERFEQAIRLLNQQKTIFIRTERFREWLDMAQALRDRRSQMRAAQYVLEQMRDLYAYYYPLLKANFTPRGAMDLEVIEALEKEPLMAEDFPLHSARAEYYRRMLRFWIANFRRDFVGARTAAQKLVRYFETTPYSVQESYTDYVQQLLRLAVIECQFGHFDEAWALLQRIRDTKPRRAHEEVQRFLAWFKGLMGYILATGDRALIPTEFATAKADFQRYKDRLTTADRLSFAFMLAKISLLVGEQDTALRYLREIERESDKKIRVDIQGMARVLMLIVLYELREFDLIWSKVRTYRGYFNKRGMFLQFERRFFRFFNHPQLDNAKFQPKEKFKALYHDLKEVFQDPFEANVLKMYDVMDWLRNQMAALEMEESIS